MEVKATRSNISSNTLSYSRVTFTNWPYCRHPGGVRHINPNETKFMTFYCSIYDTKLALQIYKLKSEYNLGEHLRAL